MSAKIILIVFGSIMLLLGIILLITAKQHNWEVKEYKKINKKNVPKTPVVGVQPKSKFI